MTTLVITLLHVSLFIYTSLKRVTAKRVKWVVLKWVWKSAQPDIKITPWVNTLLASFTYKYKIILSNIDASRERVRIVLSYTMRVFSDNVILTVGKHHKLGLLSRKSVYMIRKYMRRTRVWLIYEILVIFFMLPLSFLLVIFDVWLSS